MLKHLLVGLDGSLMAESAAVVAAGLAGRTGARVTLLHVLEESPPLSVHGERHLAQEAEAEQYLRDLAKRIFPPGAEVACHVHPQPTRRLAKDLALHAEEFRPDLVVLCAHGGVRIRDRIRGNIAQQLVGMRACPVLLLQARPRGEAIFPFRSILVPLDGQAVHERCLPLAREVAAACDAEMLLLTVVPSPGMLRGRQQAASALLPAATQEMMKLEEEQAASHLAGLIGQIGGRGLRASARVVRGDPAREIIREAKEAKADLIALGTHGRAGTDAFWAGTVTPKLLRGLRAGFLLAPVAEEEK